MKNNELSSKYLLIKKASSNMFVAVVVASVIVSFSIVISKFLFDLMQFNSTVEEAQAQSISRLETNISNFEQLSADYTNFESGPKLIGSQGNRSNSRTVFDSLPSRYDFPAIASSIENIARRSSVEFTGFSGDDNQEGAVTSEAIPVPVEIPFSITIAGNYQQIQRFFTRLDQSIRPFKVNNVQMSGSDDNLRVSIQMSTFYQPAVNVNEDILRSVSQ